MIRAGKPDTTAHDRRSPAPRVPASRYERTNHGSLVNQATARESRALSDPLGEELDSLRKTGKLQLTARQGDCRKMTYRDAPDFRSSSRSGNRRIA
jgi:hypothetical protein